MVLGRRGFATLYVGAGAAVNGFFLARGDDYERFADGAYVPFVRDTWRSVVVPEHHLWIGLLITFELAVGLLVLVGGRWTELAYVGAIGFHVALLSFGWGFYLWSLPMIAALVTLLRAERSTVPEAGLVRASQTTESRVAPWSGNVPANGRR